MAATYFGTSTDNFSRTVNSTTARFFRDEEKNILQKRRLTAALQAKGKVRKNQYGDELKWPVRYKRTKLVVIGDVVNLNFPRQNKNKTAILPWAGYAVTDSISEKEKVLNKGEAAIIRQVSEIMSRLKEDMEDQFGLELYKDSAANPGRVAGCETVFVGATGTDNNKTYLPVATYAGHSTARGLLGTWSGSWPDGSGDAQYDWWSPIVLDTGGSAWTTSAWSTAALEQLRYGIFAMERTTNPLDMVLLTRGAYTDFATLLDSKEQIHTLRSPDNSLLVKLGFGSISNFEGVDITWEEGVNTGDSTALGYGYTFDKMQICTPNKQLFEPAPIDFKIESLSDRYLVRFWGQVRSNPRNSMKIAV